MHVYCDDIKDRMEAAGFLIGDLNSAEITQQRTDMIGNLKLERVSIYDRDFGNFEFNNISALSNL